VLDGDGIRGEAEDHRQRHRDAFGLRAVREEGAQPDVLPQRRGTGRRLQ
jgi:hypothetical protein